MGPAVGAATGGTRVLGVALAVAAAAVLLTGAVVTGSGPHGGDERAERFPYDLQAATRLHSGSAWVLVLLALVTAIVLSRRRELAGAARHARALLAVLVAQGAVGYVQYATGVPAGLVAVHVLGATVAWALATACEKAPFRLVKLTLTIWVWGTWLIVNRDR